MKQAIGKHDPETGTLDVMIDGTLFKAEYMPDRAQYRVVSRTPVPDREPLTLRHIVDRVEATAYREKKWIEGHSIDSSALKLGIEELQKQIPAALRKLREEELVQGELEELEGFGSF